MQYHSNKHFKRFDPINYLVNCLLSITSTLCLCTISTQSALAALTEDTCIGALSDKQDSYKLEIQRLLSLDDPYKAHSSYLTSRSTALLSLIESQVNILAVNPNSRSGKVISKHLSLLHKKLEKAKLNSKVNIAWFIDFSFRVSVILDIALYANDSDHLFITRLLSGSSKTLQELDVALSSNQIYEDAPRVLGVIENLDAYPKGQPIPLPVNFELDVEQFNKGFFSGIDFIGIVTKETLADGQTFSPMTFFEHDIGHILTMFVLRIQAIRNDQDAFSAESRRFMEKTFHQVIEENPTHQFSMNLSLFYAFHESYGLYKAIVKLRNTKNLNQAQLDKLAKVALGIETKAKKDETLRILEETQTEFHGNKLALLENMEIDMKLFLKKYMEAYVGADIGTLKIID